MMGNNNGGALEKKLTANETGKKKDGREKKNWKEMLQCNSERHTV